MAEGDLGAPEPKRKIRVAFRRNRGGRAREKDWTRRAREAEGGEIDAAKEESLVAKGDLSRHRTVIEGGRSRDKWLEGTVAAFRGQYSEVDVAGTTWLCTARRILRTRLIDNRNALTVGDRVLFLPAGTSQSGQSQGVIEEVLPRRTQLKRMSRRRVHTIAANVDQVLIVASAAQPPPKPHLIDRYLVAAHAENIEPIICLNKIDLDPRAASLLASYQRLGYRTIVTSAFEGTGLGALADVLRDKITVLAGQSGVGKSALINALQPGLNVRVGAIDRKTGKGRHTTRTATLIRLTIGGHLVDTPGIRALDLALFEPSRLQACFVEFLEHVPRCGFSDCTHRHEEGCAVLAALKRGEIDAGRYESYLRLFEEFTEGAPDRARPTGDEGSVE